MPHFCRAVGLAPKSWDPRVVVFWAASLAALLSGPDVARGAEAFLGEKTAVPISVAGPAGGPICPNFSFAQIPHRPDLFLSKFKAPAGGDVCGGAWDIALFRFDWHAHVMTFLHTVIEMPVDVGPSTIKSAGDPTVEDYRGELWVAFECGGRLVAGTASCVGPLTPDLAKIDVARLSIPISGEDAKHESGLNYSASTPKLLADKGRLLIFWSAIVSDLPTHEWLSQEERGAELLPQPDGKLMAKGSPNHWLPSHGPPRNVAVLTPSLTDPSSDASIDTEGFFETPQGIIALSSVGGRGPRGKPVCVRPRDKVAGCYRLQINRTSGDPLRPDAFAEQRVVEPPLGANPVEYPRIIIGPEGKTYLMEVSHPPYAVPEGMSALKGETAYILIPFPLTELVFQNAQ